MRRKPGVMELTAFDRRAFLRDYWQQRPLLIRRPWAGWRNPLDPDTLAGLACDDAIESRLVRQTKRGLKLEHGPFRAKRFAKLGDRPWTLLVQAVDHHVPDVAALIEAFRFIPNWRIDDVMVSYATNGGGVGAHFDSYDVFLVQGLGRRRWRVGGRCDAATPLLPHDGLRLLADFVAVDEFVLDPGDILYVPPGVAHEGVAVGDDCMTYSIGFRAPSRADVLVGWSDHLLATFADDNRYTDPGLPAQDNPGEISASALERLHALATEPLRDGQAFARWFGSHATMRKDPTIDWRPDAPPGRDALPALLAAAMPLRRNPASRFAFIRETPETLLLFVDGESFVCADAGATFAEQLAGQTTLTVTPDLAADDAVLDLIAHLLGSGSLAFDDRG